MSLSRKRRRLSKFGSSEATVMATPEKEVGAERAIQSNESRLSLVPLIYANNTKKDNKIFYCNEFLFRFIRT